jgi:hypothetical protein
MCGLECKGKRSYRVLSDDICLPVYRETSARAGDRRRLLAVDATMLVGCLRGAKAGQ